MKIVSMKLLKSLSLAAAVSLLSLHAMADEALIRKNLAVRLAGLPKVDEIRPSAMPGLWEIRIGNEVNYTDAQGNYLIQGDLIDLRTKQNLTEERVNKINMIDFATLPLKDAMVWKTGTGKRRIAVFADPNCGYCKRFEQALLETKDVTVYTFLIPILGGDSPEKAQAIWCAKDQTATWKSWMLEGKAPARVMGKCDDSAIDRNVELSHRFHVNGTPGIFFEDGSRAPGALTAEQLERRLQPAKS